MKKSILLCLLVLVTGCGKISCEEGYTYDEKRKLCVFREEIKATKKEECLQSEGFNATKNGNICSYEKDGAIYQTSIKITYTCPSYDYKLIGDKCIYEKTKKAK